MTLAGVNVVSTKTLGHLITVATTYLWESTLRDLLMKSGIYDANIPGLDPWHLVPPLPPWDLIDSESPSPNEQEMLRVPLLTAHRAANLGNRKAEDTLRELVQLVAAEVSKFSRASVILRPSGSR